MLTQVSLRKFLSKTFVKLLFADLLKRIGVDDKIKSNYQHSLGVTAFLTKLHISLIFHWASQSVSSFLFRISGAINAGDHHC